MLTAAQQAERRRAREQTTEFFRGISPKLAFQLIESWVETLPMTETDLDALESLANRLGRFAHIERRKHHD